MADQILPSSFRDPSGFLYHHNDLLLRQVNHLYKEHYDHLLDSGLYETLVDNALLISHKEVETDKQNSNQAYKIIQPELIPFISYPYEWCFSQLKKAALTSLSIQKKAMNFGMTLKDCSAYNIQFHKGKPILIDTLSFEKYTEGQTWAGYRQFCQHFLAPLSLMRYKDVRLNQLLRVNLDGIPLDLASSVLPIHSHFQPEILSHIHLHAKAQLFFSEKPANTQQKKMNRFSFISLLENLESAVNRLTVKPSRQGWTDYYEKSQYSEDSLNHKKELVAEFLDKVKPRMVWDLGANTGLFSRIASSRGILTVSLDGDHDVVEKNYREALQLDDTNLLPLLVDITNASPGLGWAHQERSSLMERGPADAVLVLGLINHLAFSNNLPLSKVAGFLKEICHNLIIEFIPKTDPQAQRLLISKKDIFPDYTPLNFVNEFNESFLIRHSVPIRGTERILYLMQKR